MENLQKVEIPTISLKYKSDKESVLLKIKDEETGETATLANYNGTIVFSCHFKYEKIHGKQSDEFYMLDKIAMFLYKIGNQGMAEFMQKYLDDLAAKKHIDNDENQADATNTH
jgi:hypothetical protein